MLVLVSVKSLIERKAKLTLAEPKENSNVQSQCVGKVLQNQNALWEHSQASQLTEVFSNPALAEQSLRCRCQMDGMCLLASRCSVPSLFLLSSGPRHPKNFCKGQLSLDSSEHLLLWGTWSKGSKQCNLRSGLHAKERLGLFRDTSS